MVLYDWDILYIRCLFRFIDHKNFNYIPYMVNLIVTSIYNWTEWVWCVVVFISYRPLVTQLSNMIAQKTKKSTTNTILHFQTNCTTNSWKSKKKSEKSNNPFNKVRFFFFEDAKERKYTALGKVKQIISTSKNLCGKN